MAYRIRNWNKHFENNKTRLLKTLTWMPVSTDLGSPGYAELVGGHPEGAAHFGFFIAMLEMASRGSPRGHLSAGIRHHDAASMALMCRMPIPMIETALLRLVNIGWVESYEESGTLVTDPALNPALAGHLMGSTGNSVGRSEGRSVDRTEDRTPDNENTEATLDPLTSGSSSPKSKARTEELKQRARAQVAALKGNGS